MARPVGNRLPGAARAAGLALASTGILLLAASSVAAASLGSTVIPISGTVAPLALLRVERGEPLVVRVDRPQEPGATGATVVSFPKALALQVVANAPWKLTLASAGEFPVKLLLASPNAGGAVQVRPDGSGGVGAYGRAGQLQLTWDVAVVVPPGTPEGVYAIPLVIELSTQ